MREKRSRILPVLMLMMLVMITAIPVSAKTYSENGTWKRKIGKTTWYFDVNDYTSREPGSKYYGVVYIYKGKKKLDNHKYCVNAQYTKLSANKYQIKYKGGKIRFTVSAKSIKLQQKSGKVKGVKLKGKFKLVKRHYS